MYLRRSFGPALVGLCVLAAVAGVAAWLAVGREPESELVTVPASDPRIPRPEPKWSEGPVIYIGDAEPKYTV